MLSVSKIQAGKIFSILRFINLSEKFVRPDVICVKISKTAYIFQRQNFVDF